MQRRQLRWRNLSYLLRKSQNVPHLHCFFVNFFLFSLIIHNYSIALSSIYHQITMHRKNNF